MPDNTPYIVASFAVTWIAILLYGIHLRRVRQDASRRLTNAREAVRGVI